MLRHGRVKNLVPNAVVMGTTACRGGGIFRHPFSLMRSLSFDNE